MTLLRTAWMRQIQENLFDSNEVIGIAQNWDQYVQEGIKTVVIPQAGLPTGFARNRSVFPAAITQRADADVTYDMVDYSADPILVQELEQLQLSYDKRQSVLNNMLMNIKDGMALDLLFAWAATTANVVETTGSATDTTLATTTGQRKLPTYADVLKLATLLDVQNIPSNGRILILPSTMYNGLMLDQDIKENFNSKLADLNKGVLGELLGFKVMKRGAVVNYSTAKAAKVPGSVAATDSQAALAYHPSFVGRSVGNINIYADPQPRPEYYGRIMSCQLQAGGKKCYSDGKGVVALREANV